MNGILEEKTPKGYILKIKPNNTFLVFNRKGGTVYADANGLNSVHRIPVLLFLGTSFIFKQRLSGNYNLLKVAKNHVLVPFYVAGRKDLHYHLIESEETIDLIPVRVNIARTLMDFAKLIEDGIKPDHILVDTSITDEEYPIIKTRYAEGKIVRVDPGSQSLVSRDQKIDKEQEESTVNLNLYSSNPVYIAMVSLREFQISKVKQILLDTDISADDAEYVQLYIDTLIKNARYPQPEKNRPRLEELQNNFALYAALLRNTREKVEAQIANITTLAEWSSAMTLLAKAKSMTDDKNLQVEYTDYENLLYEKKESFAS